MKNPGRLRLRRLTLRTLAGVFFFSGGLIARAEIAYDRAKGTVWVLDYAPEKPATLADLREAHKVGSWGIMQFNPSNNETVLNANLTVGVNDGSSSVLQIGSPYQPRETLVLKGSLTIASPKPKEYAVWEGQNGLILGQPDDTNARPVIKFDCAKAGEFCLKVEAGAQLKCYQALITSVAPDRKRGWTGQLAGGPGAVVVMSNTTLSYYADLMPAGVMRFCTFEYGPYALGNGSGYFEDCVFRNLDTAFSDGGCLDCTLIRCRLENNTQNWNLRHTSRGIRAIDSIFGAPTNKAVVCQAWKNPQSGRLQYPVFFSQKHVSLTCRDAQGAPVTNAQVTVTNDQNDNSAIGHGFTITGADGKTPGPETQRALLLTDYLCRAGDTPDKPLERQFTYTVRIVAPGYAAAEIPKATVAQLTALKDIVLKKR